VSQLFAGTMATIAFRPTIAATAGL
jgi:hypothetical protein